MVQRDTLDNGSVRLLAGGCEFLYERLQPGVLRITIRGNDVGQFGHATLDELALEYERTGAPISVFVDATRATGPSTVVMETWTAWLAASARKLQALVVLIPEGSKLLHLTVSIAKHLSRTGDVIRICSTQSEFDGAITRRLSAANGYPSRA